MPGYLHVCVCVHTTQMYFRAVRNFILPETGIMSEHKDKSDLVRRAGFRLQLGCLLPDGLGCQLPQFTSWLCTKG